MWILITWKKFENLKLCEKKELVQVENESEIPGAVQKIKQMNAEARLTTVEYKTFNLTEIFAEHNLHISEEE